MSFIDDFVQGFIGTFERIAAPFVLLKDVVDGVQDEDEQATDLIGQRIEESQPADEVAAALVDLTEEFVIADLEAAGEITPGNAEEVADQVEGGSVAVLAGAGLAGSTVEALSAGQIDQQQEYITQAIAALAVDDATGLELDARVQEGILPALEAKAGKEHRSKFVSLQDAVELALRNKQADEGFLTPEAAPARVQRLIGSTNPVNPDNLVEEWGIRDDNLPILEEVALEAMEFEELIETPAELGLVVPDDVLEEQLDLAGYPEGTKDFLRQVNDQLPRSARTYQELLTTEELVRGLDTLARNGVLSAEEAEATIPDEVPAEPEAFRERFQLLRDLPAGTPSATDFEGAFASGYLSLEELRSRLDQTDYPTDQYEAVLKKQVLDELDGDLQEAVALGLLSEGQYSDYAEFAGLDDEAIELLLQGQSFGNISKARLAKQASPDERKVGTLLGIGESRARALAAAGIETVADLAEADVETVAETAQVSPETAQEFINRAQQRQ